MARQKYLSVNDRTLCKNLCNECDRSKIKLKRLSKRSKKAAMTVTTYKWTIERYHRAIEAEIFDDQPIELLRGDLIVMSPELELDESTFELRQ
ncbi:hypothetical protein [Nostoc sp.]|uniref:hypothetical protein n=1 Tax=Nostoc sp. TaxID=1180 RepID=UPI003FA5EC1D